MGNRGTTPSWDEEEIAKYGFMMHMSSLASRRRALGARALKKGRQSLVETLRHMATKKAGNGHA